MVPGASPAARDVMKRLERAKLARVRRRHTCRLLQALQQRPIPRATFMMSKSASASTGL
jgi:hypothetical protein